MMAIIEPSPDQLAKSRQYRSYLLRAWREGGQAPKSMVWRFSLEEIGPGQKRGFASLDELFEALERELTNDGNDT